MSDGTTWSEHEWDEQLNKLVAMFGAEQSRSPTRTTTPAGKATPSSGTGAVKHGIQLDQSKGASKTGEAGLQLRHLPPRTYR